MAAAGGRDTGGGGGEHKSGAGAGAATDRLGCRLGTQERAVQTWLQKKTWESITPNGVHALPGECSEPEPGLLRDVSVKQYFGVPENITGPIVEVGTNRGADLSTFVTHYPAAKIFSYEPVPELVATLKKQRWVEYYAGIGQVHLMNVGIGGKDEDVAFHSGKDGNEAISAYDDKVTAKGPERKLHVIAITEALGDVQKATGQVPEALSFNCEGCEYPSLLSFVQSEWLGKVRFIQLSWHLVDIPGREKIRCRVEAALRGAGYRPTYVSYFGWYGWALPCGTSKQT